MSPELKTPPQRRLVRTDTPGIYRRGNRYIAVTYRHGRRIKTTHDTKRDACEARARRTCGAPLPSRERFEDYTERWLVEYRGRTSRGLAPSTREAYAWTMRTYVIPYFRGTRIGDLRRADVKRFIDHLASIKPRQPQQGVTRLAGSTIRKILTPLKAMLAEAHELDLLTTDAGRVRVVVGHVTPVGPPKTMTREQINALLEHLDPRGRLLILVLRWTGLRIAEALGLRWHDLDNTDQGPVLLVRRQWQDGRLVEHTKTAAGARAVAVVPSLAQALTEARANATFDAPHHPIFATRHGTHQDSHNLRRRLRPAALSAGVPWMTPHVLRHSLATELLDHGYDISAIANVLGHRSEAFTRRIYVHARETPRFDDLDT
jgi:integrase